MNVVEQALPEFSVDELHIRLQTLEDADIFFRAMKRNADYLTPWTGTYYQNVTEDENRQGIVDNLEETRKGNSYVFGVYVDQELCCVIDIRDLDTEEPEVGYWTDERYRGRSVAPRAVLAMIDFVRKSHPFDSVVLHTDVNNDASSRVAEKMGFMLAGTVTRREKEKKLYRKELSHSGQTAAS